MSIIDYMPPLVPIVASSVVNAILAIFNWRLVRAFGALTILTRASYAMLVVVPLMAGAWPAVQTIINASEQKLVNVSDRLTRSAEQFSETAQKIKGIRRSADGSGADQNEERDASDWIKRSSKIASEAEQLSEKIRKVHDSQSTYMPAAWGLAFFAALAVALGQVFYQTSAPEIVRHYTLEEYQEFKSIPKGREPTSDEVNDARRLVQLAEFNQGTFLNKKIVACLKLAFECTHVFEAVLALRCGLDLNQTVRNPKLPSQDDMRKAAETDDVQDAIATARRGLRVQGSFYARDCLELLQDHDAFEDLLELARRGSVDTDVITVPKYWDTTSYLAQHHLMPPFDQEGAAAAHNRERVWIGARVEYLDQSRTKARVRCFLTLILYLLATSLIAYITVTQALSVAEAVGWVKSAKPMPALHMPLRQAPANQQ